VLGPMALRCSRIVNNIDPTPLPFPTVDAGSVIKTGSGHPASTQVRNLGGQRNDGYDCLVGWDSFACDSLALDRGVGSAENGSVGITVRSKHQQKRAVMTAAGHVLNAPSLGKEVRPSHARSLASRATPCSQNLSLKNAANPNRERH